MSTTLDLSSLEYYGFCDPASGKQVVKRARARSAIVVIGMDYLERFFLMLAWAGRPTTPKLLEKLIEVGGRFPLRRFGIEANAMQSLFADLVMHQARELKKRIPFIGIPQPTKIDKDWRIRTTTQPVIESGRLFMLDTQHEARNEIQLFPMSPMKDIVDCIASAIRLAPRRATVERQKSETDALARYLRESGAPPSYIQSRIEEVQRESLEKSSIDNKDGAAYNRDVHSGN